MSTVAFDCDYSLVGADNAPNYPLIGVLRWFLDNGDHVIIWSAGGAEYAGMWASKLGFAKKVTVLAKNKENAEIFKVDIAFDDEFIHLGKVNIKLPPGDKVNAFEPAITKVKEEGEKPEKMGKTRIGRKPFANY